MSKKWKNIITLNQIVDALAMSEPFDGELGYCALCHEDNMHDEKCPYRMACEYIGIEPKQGG